ncbi:response regulator [Flavihumibacter sp. ZG627]|uniref:response regulator n=1 Tax=Flavihumibacter sp. ZG627 TaxID=1463156 RepID=UPI00069498F0|nr:response regulator [Flavihumibacter sp. ZG627]
MSIVNSHHVFSILFAEDDEDDREFLMHALRNVGSYHKVHMATNGKEALEILFNLSPEDGLPCVIILDLNMPVLDGIQTLEILNHKASFQHIPKIIFTTSASEIDRVRSLSKGATDFVVKPSNMPDFVKTVEGMLRYCM